MLPRIDRARLRDLFQRLVVLDSPSLEEGRVAGMIKGIFGGDLGLELVEDGSREVTGSQSGNIVARIPGAEPVPPLFFNAHLDTVEPGRGIRPIFQDGVFRTDGSTILGADDKAAVAILIEVASVLKEAGVHHGPLELVFTVCEEIGLRGAKALDPSLLQAKAGYALDSTDPEVLINRAPAAIRFKLKVTGRAAHAGLRPEDGINAIHVAAKALVQVPLGRIDEDTTANVGVIRGGKATNIVPEECELEGEVRSHDPRRLRAVQDRLLGVFHEAALGYQEGGAGVDRASGLPRIQTEVADDYPSMWVEEGHPLIVTARAAAGALGRELRLAKTGGGSDANVFNGKGLATVIMGVGMQKVHSTEEFIRLDDMAAAAELVLKIVQHWGRV